MSAPDFFQPGRTYQRRRWLFQCLAVAPNPFNGEIRAVGFLYRPGEPATATALDPDDWAHGGWADASEGGIPAAEPTLTVYRASHDSIVMGLYATREAARAHCMALLLREDGDRETYVWVPDDGDELAAEELCVGYDVECTGYVVTPIEVASEYDAEADE